MIKQKVKVQNKLGMHARPASLIVKTASGFESDIHIEKDGTEISAKSIMGLMTLAASYGSTLTITADGEDEKEAMEAIKNVFDSKFGEE